MAVHAVTLVALVVLWASSRSGYYVRYQTPPQPLMHANYYTFHEMSVRMDEGAWLGNINLTRVSQRPFDRPYEPYDTVTPPGSTYCDYYTLDPGFGLIVHAARKLLPFLPDSYLRTLALQGIADLLTLALLYCTIAIWSWPAAVVGAGLYATNPVFGYVVTIAFYYFWDGLLAIAVFMALVWAGRFSRRSSERAACIASLAALGALLGFGVWLRASWTTYAAVLFATLLLSRPLRRNLWVAVAAFVIVASLPVYRASRAEGHFATSARMLWHTAHQRLGRFPNPFGIEDDDGYQFELAKAEYGVDYNYCSYRKQDEAMRDHYRKVFRADPWFVVRSVSGRIFENVFWNAAVPNAFPRVWNWGLLAAAFIGAAWLFLRGGERRMIALVAVALFATACGAIGFVYYVNGNYANFTQICLVVLAAGAGDFVAALRPSKRRPGLRRVKAIGRLARKHSTTLGVMLAATAAIGLCLSLPWVRDLLTRPRATEWWVAPNTPTTADLQVFDETWQALPAPRREEFLKVVRSAVPPLPGAPGESVRAYAARELLVVRSYDVATGAVRKPVWLARRAAAPAFNALSRSSSSILGWKDRSVVGFDLDAPASWDGCLVRVSLEPTTGMAFSRVAQLMTVKFVRWGFQLREQQGDEFVYTLE